MHPWDVVFLVGFIAYVLIRGWFDHRTRRNGKALSCPDGRERLLLLIVFAGCLLLPAVYLFTPWLEFAEYRLAPLLSWCGAFIMIGALWLFWRAHRDLGQNWSVSLELRNDHRLVEGGIYRRIRHPMYAAIWLFSLSQGLLLHNWLAGWSGLVAFAIMYLVRVPREEEMMLEHFGQYRNYMARTGRVFPRFKGGESRTPEPSAAPNGGPATQLGDSGATEGPPSVS